MMRLSCAVLLAMLGASPALAWNAHGHRTIAYLALDRLPADAPEWLRDPAVRHRIADASNEPDRYRGWRVSPLAHANEPDHYIDLDMLDQFGLTFDSLPELRYEYLRALAIAKHVHPENVTLPYDAADDANRTKEWPGYLPYAIAEHYAKLQHSFNVVRVLERLNEPQRAWQLEQARANAIYEMGMLSHFVGDAAQPLHTTYRYNGWVGDNPNEYTVDRKFHSFIDGGVLEVHGLTYETLRPLFKPRHELKAMSPWPAILEHIRRSHAHFETLYQMEKDGRLRSEPGKELIVERLLDAGDMLGAMYAAAWRSAAPNEKQLADFAFYNELKPERLPAAPQPAAASQPADSAP